MDKDEQGRAVQPVIFEYTLGVDRLKELTLERLAVADGGPGQVYFHAELEDRYVEEYFGESLIDGKWRRNGPNENLDLHGYAEAGRQILGPERQDIKWEEGKLPVWATPILLDADGGSLAAPASEQTAKAEPKSFFEKHRQLHKDDE